jgi:hypothetical protein
MIVRSLGAVGLATREVVLGLVGALLVAGLLRARRPGLGPWPRVPIDPRWRVPLAALAALPLPMAFAPAISYDSLVYQLRFPEMTLWSGRWAFDSALSPSFFPAATETAYVAMLAVDASGVSAQVLHWSFFVASLVAILLLARRLATAPSFPAVGECAALLFGAIPAAGIVAGWSWSDMSLCFALLTSCLALAERQVAPAAALLGLAAAVKYSGLALAVPIAVAIVVLAIRERRAGSLALGGLLGAAIAAPWYVFNWVHTSNPLYPLMPGLFGQSGEASSRILNWSTATDGASWWSYAVRPQSLDADLGGILGLVALSIALVQLIRARRFVPAAILLGALGVLAPFAPAARILLPPLAGACVGVGLAVGSVGDPRARRWWLAGVAAFALRGEMLIGAHNSLFFGPLPAAVGIEPESDYRKRNFPPDALFSGAAGTLPDDARVLVFGESRLFRFPRWTHASAMVDPPAVLPYLDGAVDADAVLDRCRRAGYTHLLVSLDALRGTPDTVAWRRGISGEQLTTLRQVIQRCAPLARAGGLGLLALPPPAAAARPAGS